MSLHDATLGGDATLGPPLPATLGGHSERREFVEQTETYRVTLENPDGETRVLEPANAPNAVSIDLTHSGLSTFSIDVPMDRDLQSWRWANIEIEREGQTRFVGEVERVGWDESFGTATTSLEGKDSGIDLESGEHELDFTNVVDYRLIRAAWDTVAPEWRVHVIEPVDSISVEEIEADGSPLDILQDVHEELNYRFVIDPRYRKRAYAFRIDDLVRRQTWEPVGEDRDRDREGYYNQGVVRGARKPDGSRYKGQYTDDAAVQALADELEIAFEDAIETFSVLDSSLESDQQCRRRAESIVRERVQEDTLAGSEDIWPQPVHPGPSYAVGRDSATGKFSRRFTGSEYIDVPPEALAGHETGTLLVLARADWTQSPSRRILGSRHTGGADSELRTGTAPGLPFVVGNGSTTVSADAFPDIGEPDAYGEEPYGDSYGSASKDWPESDEWILLHWAWRYDEAADETTLQGGHDGDWNDSAVIDGHIQLPDDALWIGRYHNEYATVDIDSVQIHDWFIENPPAAWGLPSLHYRFERREEVVAADDDRVIDAAHGYHGVNHGTNTIGDILSVESCSLSESHGSVSGEVSYERPRGLRPTLERERRERNRTRRGI